MKNMNKAVYISPEMQVAFVGTEDLITTSGSLNGLNESGDSMTVKWG